VKESERTNEGRSERSQLVFPGLASKAAQFCWRPTVDRVDFEGELLNAILFFILKDNAYG
jgi:hypothetical protein